MKKVTNPFAYAYNTIPFYRRNVRTLNTLLLVLLDLFLSCVFGLIKVNWSMVLSVMPMFLSAFLLLFLLTYGIVQSRKRAKTTTHIATLKKDKISV